MDKGSGYQDTGTKVFAEEEYFRRNLHPLDFLCDDWKPASSNGRKEYNDFGAR